MIDFHNAFCQVFINFSTVKAQITFYFSYFPAEPGNINTRSSFQRLKQLLRKSNKGLNSDHIAVHRYGTNCQLKLKDQEAQIASNTI